MIQNVSVFIDSNGVWENFSLQLHGSEYQCWIIDSWKYSSCKSKLIAIANRTNNAEELIDSIMAFARDFPMEFSFVLVGKNVSIAIVDHMRSRPIFYHENGTTLWISNQPEQFIDSSEIQLDKSELRKFMLSGLVPEEKTLISDVMQVPAGEALIVRHGMAELKPYYHFWRRNSSEYAVRDLADLYQKQFLHVIDEMLHANPDKQIILLLSGGMDSRYILWALYKLAPAADNITLCTYGRPYRRDADWARQIAEVTPFDWKFVPLTFHGWRYVYHSAHIQEYFDRNHFYTNLPYYQEFYALLYCEKKGIFPENSIFINGDSGGLLSGSHLTSTPNPSTVDEDEIREFLVRKKFRLWDTSALSNEEMDDLRQSVSNGMEKMPATNRTKYNVYDWWEWKEHTAKFLMSAKYQLEYFGHQLFHPFWDKRVVEVFEKLPLEQRQKQRFYHSVYKDVASKLDPNLLDAPVTKPGKAKFLKKYRRALEFATDSKWGRYSPEDISNARRAARLLLHTDKFRSLPTVNGMNAGVLLWKLIQKYPAV